MDLQTARRIALGAQGFGRSRPKKATLVHLRRAVKEMGLLQLDSVQYICRSHYLPAFSRVGAYETTTLDKLTYASDEVLETWAHEASLIRMEHEPLFRWHKQRAREGQTWGHLHRFSRREPAYVRDVQQEIAERGPLRHNDLSDPRPSQDRGFWAGSSFGKMAMEWMFRTGDLCARRDQRFQRVFDLSERIIPEEIRDRPTPSASEAQSELLLLAAGSHGIGSADCLADYYRIKIREARPLLEKLVAEGRLERVHLEGHREPWYQANQTKAASVSNIATILSPFDPLVWNRKRNVKLFDFDYKIEIYLPEKKRRYGYYVLPFLLGDRIAGRVELKSDRKGDTLLVVGAWLEAEQDAKTVAAAMASSIREFAQHLKLSSVRPARKGNLAGALRKAL